MNKQPLPSPTLEFLKEVKLSFILVNPHQPRKHFEEEKIDELSASIKEIGIIHPPTVSPIHGTNNFELISGERRLRAAKRAGLTKITVLVKDYNSFQSAQSALIENIQRQDLNPLEIAISLKNLSTQYGLNQKQLAKKIGKQRSTIANYLRLLSLPQAIQTSLKQGEITMGHAKIILSLSSIEKQLVLNDSIVLKTLTVRQAKLLANKLSQKTNKPHYQSRNFYLEELAEKMQCHLGSKVTIHPLRKKKGSINIEYYDWEDLERLLDLLHCKHDQ